MKRIIIAIVAICALGSNVEGKNYQDPISYIKTQSSDWEYLGLVTLYYLVYENGRWVKDDRYKSTEELWVRIIGNQTFYKVKEKGTQSKDCEWAVVKNPNYGKPGQKGAEFTHYVDADGSIFYFNL